MKRWMATWLLLFAALLPAASSQSSPAANDPISAALKLWYGASKNNIIASAEKMPEADFDFRPAREVRSFSELLIHIADTQYQFCSQLRGEANPNQESVAKTRKTRDEIIQAVKASFSYCDKAFIPLNDAALKEKVGTQGNTRVDWAMFSVYHLGSHYGNIVTYLRLKGIVPPNSEIAASRTCKRCREAAFS